MKVPEPRKLKSGTWFIQLRLNGVSIPVTASTSKECKRQAALIKAEHMTGKREIKNAEYDLTLEQAIIQYIEKKYNVLSPSTRRGYETIKNTRFLSVSNQKLKTIKDWQSIINDEAQLCSAKTLKNAWFLVAAVLRQNKLPVPEVTLPQIITNDMPWLEPEQIKIFVHAVKDEKFSIPALLALHGMRRSEIYGLKWENIDLDHKTIKISGASVFDENHKLVQKPENKNKSSARTIPIMIPELESALKTVENKTGNVVQGNPNSLYRQVNRICRKNGLPEVGVHGLRHSFASLGYHLGLSELEMMELGGWSDIQTMRKIYIKLSKADRIKAKNKMTMFYETYPEE